MSGEYDITSDADFNKFDGEDVEDIAFLNVGEAGLAIAGFIGLIVIVAVAVWAKKQNLI